MPLLTIGMPVYNAKRYLEAGLQSILNQTFTDFELIISDNASTDCTPEICRQYAAQDKRIRFHQSDVNRGGGWNHQRVLDLAGNTPYFKWEANDDLCHPTFLEKCIAVLETNKGAVLAHSKTSFIDESGSKIEDYDERLEAMRTDAANVITRFTDLALAHHGCYQIYGVIRKSVLDKVGGQPIMVHGDGVFLAHLALYGPYIKIPEYLFFSRRHSAQSSQTLPDRLRNRRFRLINRSNGLPSMDWWDTSKTRAIVFPHWKRVSEFQNMVNSAPLSARDKMRCHRITMRWMLQDRRRLVKDLLIAGDQALNNMFAPGNNPALAKAKAGGTV